MKKTILVADPRIEVQARLEYGLASYGYDVTGPEPDLVLTPDDATARFWSRKGVPVYSYGGHEPPMLEEILATVAAILDRGEHPLPP